MNQYKYKYKYKYFFLPKKFKAIADIHIAFTEFKTSGKVVVREKIDLVKGLFSNDGTGERTFVEIPNGDTIYIERKLLVPVPLFFKAEKKFQEQVKALRIYANLRYDGTVTGYETIAKEALKEIEQ